MTDNNTPRPLARPAPYPLPVRIAANVVAVLLFPIWFPLALAADVLRGGEHRVEGNTEVRNR